MSYGIQMDINTIGYEVHMRLHVARHEHDIFYRGIKENDEEKRGK